MTHYTDDPDAKKAATDKARETRLRLGPRLGRVKERLKLPPDFAGTVARRRRAKGVPGSHPTRDSGATG